MDGECDEPIDLSLKNVSPSTDYTRPSPPHNNHPSSSMYSTSSPVSATSLTSTLLPYLLLTRDTSSHAHLLKLLTDNLSSVQDTLDRSDSREVSKGQGLQAQLCHADTTAYVEDLHLQRYSRGDRNRTRLAGRPLTGRYVKNGRGASESTLALLRETIELRMSGHHREVSSKQREVRRSNKQRLKSSRS